MEWPEVLAGGISCQEGIIQYRTQFIMKIFLDVESLSIRSQDSIATSYGLDGRVRV
jgi:hypothetical protein